MNPIPKRSPTLRPAMTSIPCSKQPKSSSIVIRASISNSTSGSEDVNELSESAERRYLYDASTWRMYYRILNGRKRRTQVAAMTERNPVSSISSAKKKEISTDSFSYKYSKHDKKRSLSVCSDSNARETNRDEEIFALDL